MPEGRPLGIVCAMAEEMDQLRPALLEEGSAERGGFLFRSGRIGAVPAVLVQGGVGKVNTAVVVTIMLDLFDCRGIVFAGVAGGLDPALGIGDVILADRLIQHDYGALVEGRIRPFRPGVPPLGESRKRPAYELAPALRQRLAAALAGLTLPELPAAAAGGRARRPALRFGTVLTGDQFINCAATGRRLFETFGAQAVDMESAAAAQVAERYGVPCVVVRSLSDMAGAESHLDLPAFLGAAAAGAAAVVRRLLPAL